MITVHRLNGTWLLVNAELIESVEPTPDTVLTLVNGKKILVQESAEEIREAVIAYRRRIGCPDGNAWAARLQGHDVGGE